MSVRARGRKCWRVRLRHEGRQYEWIVRTSRVDADALEARKRLELEAADPATLCRSVPTFYEFCTRHYRPHAELHLRASSWYAQSFMLATLLEHLGHRKLTEIRAEHVDTYTRLRRREGLSAVSVNNELRVLRRVRNFARERKVPVSDFRVEMLSEGERRPKSWTSDELGRLLAACVKADEGRAATAREEAARRRATRHAARYGTVPLDAPAILPLVVFLANTGCRKGEALALTWESVDLQLGEIRIWPSDEWRPKNGKPREIPISDSLRPWLSVDEKDRRSAKWVFPNEKGERYATFPKRLFREVVNAAKLSGGPHRLRHTFASLFLGTVPDLGLLAAILGHSDQAVTRLYTHMLPDRLAKARNVVSVAPPVGPAIVAAKRKWGSADVQDLGEMRAGVRAEQETATR
jgi:integrase